jgi:apolipoprotein N-acyltransferase
MGNSQYPWPIILQIADVFGVAAVTFLIYRVNAVLYLLLRAKVEGRRLPVRALLVTAAMLGVTLIYGAVRMHQTDAAMAAAPKLQVGIAEGDVGIFERETKERRRNHLLIQQRLSAQLESEGAELIVWSESSYRAGLLPHGAKRLPRSERPFPKDVDQDLFEHATYEERNAPQRGFHTPLLFGGTAGERATEPRWEGDGLMRPYNTAFLLDADGNVKGSYDKNYLLVMGEYVPFAKQLPFLYKWIPAAGSLEAGTDLKVIESNLWPEKGGPFRFGVLVCYEGLLPGFVRPLGAQRPHALFNLTNDDWFGVTAERWLHLILTIPRAIEHRVPLVRSTLTGVSLFVDANGRIIKHTAPTEPETLMWAVPLMQSSTVYQVIGDAFSYACLLWMLALYGVGRWRRRR